MINQVLEMKDKGYTYSEIAKTIGKSRSAVSGMIYRYKQKNEGYRHSKRKELFSRLH